MTPLKMNNHLKQLYKRYLNCFQQSIPKFTWKMSSPSLFFPKKNLIFPFFLKQYSYLIHSLSFLKFGLFIPYILFILYSLTPIMTQAQIESKNTIDKEKKNKKKHSEKHILPIARMVYQEEKTRDQDEIIAIGSLLPIRQTDLTTNSLIIDQARLQYHTTRYLTDFLKSIAGLSVSSSGSPGSFTQIRIRGSEANHMLVFIDNQAIASSLDGSFNLAQIPTAQINRIELLRGGQSALWGSGAISGVINIITQSKTHLPEKQLYYTLEYGRYQSLQNNISIAFNPKDQNFKLNTSYTDLKTKGYDVSGQSGEKDGTHQRTWRVTLSYQAKPDGIQLVSNAYWFKTNSDYDQDTDFNGILDNTNHKRISEMRVLNLSLNKTINQFQHLFSASLSDEKNKTNPNSYQTEAQKLIASYTGGYTYFFTHKKTEHAFTQKNMPLSEHASPYLNINWRAEWKKEQFKTRYNQINTLNHGLKTYGIALESQGRFGPGNRFLVSSSIRYDHHNLFSDALTWQFGVAVLFIKDKLKIRANYGKATQSPNAFELFGSMPDFFLANPDLKPEKSLSFETGLDYQSDYINFSASYFKSNLKDEIITEYNSTPLTVRNLNKKSIREGVEFELSLLPKSSFSHHFSYTYLISKENSLTEIRRPKHKASLTSIWNISSLPLKISTQFQYVGRQKDIIFKSPKSERITLKPHYLFHAQIYYILTKNLELTLRGENLFNVNYQDVYGYHQAGISLFAGLRLKL